MAENCYAIVSTASYPHPSSIRRIQIGEKFLASSTLPKSQDLGLWVERHSFSKCQWLHTRCVLVSQLKSSACLLDGRRRKWKLLHLNFKVGALDLACPVDRGIIHFPSLQNKGSLCLLQNVYVIPQEIVPKCKV